MTLEELIEPAFNGAMANGITIDGHGFEVKPLVIQSIENGLKVDSSFRHLVKGKDDRIHYVLESVTGQPVRATLSKIDYNGLFGRDTVNVGATFLAAVSGGGAVVGIEILKGILKGLSVIQRKLVGNWEPSAVKLIDALGARLARHPR